jgi:hypothetical protein
MFERALHLTDRVDRDAGIARSRVDVAVSERTRVTLITFLRY